MYKIAKSILISIFLFSQILFGADGGEKVNNIYQFSVKNIDGKEVNLSEYKGKVLLIVNVASKCGYTRQYEGLQKIYEQYRSEGLEILGFPCNDFGGQEPGTNEEIVEFCTLNFGVEFPMFDKIKVLGDDKDPLYQYLTTNEDTGKGDIGWNFEKFLISKEGKILGRYKSGVKPESEELTIAITNALK
ncbi:MAG: glutathione peroxidase [Melioribacteraceae bacterium]|nr:MAG: glutathione peroxidase [Melioribacteraceae bacterium]